MSTSRTQSWLRGRERWWGAAAGILLAATDTATMAALGISFAMNGHDVSVLVAGFLAISFATLGFLLGAVIEGRQRDRENALLLRAQTETIASTRSRLAQSEKLAALGQLAAAIAHEVRNPLAVIRSSAQSIGETVRGDPEADRACSFITAEIDRLGTVIESLLGFARPPRLTVGAVPVEGLLDRALLIAGDDLAAHGLRVRRHAPPGLPPIRGDADLLCQVLLGLLINASAVVPDGGEVSVEAYESGGEVELAVADSGPGVPPELRQHIFEPFFTTRPRGVGLGLAVARQIVGAHAGRIDVTDAPAGGARFTIRLPVAGGAAVAA